MELRLKVANNGYVMEIWEDGEMQSFSVFEDAKSEEQATIEMLNVINDTIGCPGSRYDAKRVYIIAAPGDKHDDFTDKHSDVIWGEDD